MSDNLSETHDMATSTAVKASSGQAKTANGDSRSLSVAQSQPAKAPATIQAGDKGLVLTNLDEYWRMAQFVIQANMAPRGVKTPAEVLIILQAGAEAGLGYTQSLANICVVNNRPCIWGDALPALVRNSGLCEYIEETVTGRGEQMVATCKSKRKGDPKECVRQFGYADAKQAALLGKDTYKNWPQRMFAMRARAWCLRDLYADVLSGLSVAEEMQEASPEGAIAITSGDNAPLNSLDDAAELLGADDDKVVKAEFAAKDAAGPTPEELADPEYAAKQGSIPW